MVRAVTNSVHTVTHYKRLTHEVNIGVLFLFNFPETCFKRKDGFFFNTLECATKKIYFENCIVNINNTATLWSIMLSLNVHDKYV